MQVPSEGPPLRSVYNISSSSSKSCCCRAGPEGPGRMLGCGEVCGAAGGWSVLWGMLRAMGKDTRGCKGDQGKVARAMRRMLRVARRMLKDAPGCRGDARGRQEGCSRMGGVLGAARGMLRDAGGCSGPWGGYRPPGGEVAGGGRGALGAAGRRCGGPGLAAGRPGAAGAEPWGAPPDGGINRRGADAGQPSLGRPGPGCTPACSPARSLPARSPAPWRGGSCRGAPGGPWCCWG